MRTLLSLAILLTFAGGALAGPTPAQRCTSSKLKAAAKNGSSDAKCASKASKDGVAIDDACLDKSYVKVILAFSKAEAKGGCLTIGDAAPIEGIVDGVTSFAAANLMDDGSKTSRKCASSRRTAAGKYVSAALGCHAKGALAGLPPETECLTKAQDKLVQAFDKSETSADGNCDTADAAATRASMDAIVDAVVAALAGVSTTTTTSVVTTTTTTTTIVGTVSFATNVQPIFDASCVSCHSGPVPPVGLNLSSAVSYANLVNVLSTECTTTKRVDPGSPSTSYLVHKLAGSGPCFFGFLMPLGGSPLSVAQQMTISTWIMEGAQNN